MAMLVALPFAVAHDDPGSTTFQMPLPNISLGGAATMVTLVGPPAGQQVLHTTWNLTYNTNGTTSAADLQLDLDMQVNNTYVYWSITGADLGWGTGPGSFTATLGDDMLNGITWDSLGLGFSQAHLSIDHVNGGGVSGNLIGSTIDLEVSNGEMICQQDLGFAGPGDVSLQICGAELATAASATLTVAGALPSAAVYLVVSFEANPTPFSGGVLVTVPVALVIPTVADAGGAIALQVPGGGGPVSVFVQAAAEDGSTPFGFALSNAVQVDFQP